MQSQTLGPGPFTIPNSTADLIDARVAALVAARRARQARFEEETFDRHWWIVGLLMFALGLADGFGWWFIQMMVPHLDVLPRLLP